MISNIEEFKALVLWAKSEGLKRIKLNDIEVEISDYIIASDLAAKQGLQEEPLSTSATMVDTEKTTKEEDDQLLYWSSQGR